MWLAQGPRAGTGNRRQMVSIWTNTKAVTPSAHDGWVTWTKAKGGRGALCTSEGGSPGLRPPTLLLALVGFELGGVWLNVAVDDSRDSTCSPKWGDEEDELFAGTPPPRAVGEGAQPSGEPRSRISATRCSRCDGDSSGRVRGPQSGFETPLTFGDA